MKRPGDNGLPGQPPAKIPNSWMGGDNHNMTGGWTAPQSQWGFTSHSKQSEWRSGSQPAPGGWGSEMQSDWRSQAQPDQSDWRSKAQSDGSSQSQAGWRSPSQGDWASKHEWDAVAMGTTPAPKGPPPKPAPPWKRPKDSHQSQIEPAAEVIRWKSPGPYPMKAPPPTGALGGHAAGEAALGEMQFGPPQMAALPTPKGTPKSSEPGRAPTYKGPPPKGSDGGASTWHGSHAGNRPAIGLSKTTGLPGPGGQQGMPAFKGPPPSGSYGQKGGGSDFQWGMPGSSENDVELMMNADLLRQGEELLRKGQELQRQQQQEMYQAQAELQRQEEEQRWKAAEEERKRLYEEHMRQQEERRKEMEARRKAEEDRRKAEEEIRKQEGIAAAKELQAGLEELKAKFDSDVEKAKHIAAPVAGQDKKDEVSDDDMVRLWGEFEQCMETVRKAHKDCTDYTFGKHAKFSGPTEETRLGASKLIKSLNDSKRDIEQMAARFKVMYQPAKERKDKEAAFEAARKAKEKEEQTFKQYDADGDGVLNGEEIVAFAKGQYDIDLSQDKVESILKSDAVAKPKAEEIKNNEHVVVNGRKGVVTYGPDDDKEYKVKFSDGEISDYMKASAMKRASELGTPLELFAQLRGQVEIAREEIRAHQRQLEAEAAAKRAQEQTKIVRANIPKAESAIEFVESEIVKVEKKSPGLAMMHGNRGPPPEIIEERAEEVERAVDAAKDFLEAAKEQASGLAAGLGREPEASVATLLTLEGRKLTLRLQRLEERLQRITSMVEACKNRVVLARKKAALMRELNTSY